MRSRAIRIAILLFQSLWLNVVVPGHTRGIVALPGEGCPGCDVNATNAAVPSCCSVPEGEAGAAERHPLPKHGDPAQHCAICSFAAHLSVPVAADLTLLPLGLAWVMPPWQSESQPSVLFFATYDGRGPPQAPSISA